MAQEMTEVVDIMSLPQADSFSDTDTLILQKSSGATQRASSKKLKDYINSDFMTSVEVKEENLEQEYQKNKTALENYTEDKKTEMNAFVTQKESELNSQFGDIATNEQERKTNETNRVNAENKRTEDFTQLKQSLESAVQSASLLNVEVEETENSYSVKITDKNGVSKTSPNLLNTIGIGTVQTGAYEDGATASITGSFGNQKLNLRIPVGRPFVIKKAYASVSAMELSIKNDLDVGEFCIIDTGSVEDADTGKLYMRTDDEVGYSYLTDLSGAQGIQGPIGLTGATPNLTIGTVETGAEGSQATATITGTAENPILNLTIPRGMTGTVENISGASIPYSSSEDEKSIKDVVDDKLGKTEQASDSATVNGHTVESNVPANAQFTDTVPEVDAELSETSTNAVQNKVVNAAIAKKADIILYDKSANTLYLKSGSTVLSSTEIKSGGESNRLTYYETRPTSADKESSSDRVGSIEAFVASSKMTTGKPMADAKILQMNWDNTSGWDSQLAMINSGTLQHRNMSNGKWKPWKTILDSSNYTDYVTGTVLTATLTAGETTLEITSEAIKTTSTVDLYTDVYGINPTNATVADGSLTLTFKAQTKDISVKAVIK